MADRTGRPAGDVPRPVVAVPIRPRLRVYVTDGCPGCRRAGELVAHLHRMRPGAASDLVESSGYRRAGPSALPGPSTRRSTDSACTSRGTATSFLDAETGSRWNILGEAVDGPLTGAQLEPADHLDPFWFAWAAFHPSTRIAEIR